MIGGGSLDGAVVSRNLVRFVRALRGRGLAVGPGTAADLAGAVDAVGLVDRDDLRSAFRAVTVVRPAERPIFDEVFDRFFGEGAVVADGGDVETVALPGDGEPARVTLPVLSKGAGEVVDDTMMIEEIVGGSYVERLGGRDFGDLDDEEAQEVRALIARMVWRPADTRSRRWRSARDGSRPDLRRTLRHLAGPSGDLMLLSYRAPRIRRRPLVVLADISGSMERYTEMFLHFVHAAQGRLGRVESFVFATRLTRITREMRRRSPAEAIAEASAAVEDWSGGTRIGEALRTFNWEWSRRVTRGGAIGLVISDGWDTGDPELLSTEMARFARSVHRVVWLNPLAGRAGYAPETRGMRAVLPHVDDLLAAASVQDLRTVVRLLESVPARRGAVGR